MKKIIGFGIVILILIIGAGVFFYFALDDKPQAVIDQSESDMTGEELSGFERQKDAEFNMIDLVHKGQGQAAVYSDGEKNILRFENFSVTSGPDLFVYLSKEKNLDGLRPEIGEFVSLGKLKSSKGEQTYILPDNYEDYGSVLVWCRAFGVLFSVAEFK